MTWPIDRIVALARLSAEDPRLGARAILDLDVPVAARTAGLMLVAVASTLIMHVGYLVLPVPDDPLVNFLMVSPLRTAVVQWVVLAISVLLIYRVGLAFGGTGTFSDALLVTVWLQVLMLLLQVVQLVALMFLPPLAVLINVLGLVLFFWMLTGFIAELHGFSSRAAVFAGIVLTIFAVAFALVVILLLLLGPEAIAHV